MKDFLFGLDGPAKFDEDLELLTTVYDNVELSILRSVLEGEKIPYMIRERGSGSSVRIITGFTMYGTDVFVPKTIVEQAKEVLEAYRNAEPIADDVSTEDSSVEDIEP
ncbi:MAG: DUF2007 domain-containing protein [Ruminococcaceae bacterium]|nr:DUF2007 domain-containing protein [Oscillospiraceae bacterium]